VKAKSISYWICTALVAFAIGSGGIAAALQVPQVVEGQMHLGYPLHFVVMLGVWKTLGAITILVPGFALAKEWAYAGVFIDLTGATVAAAAAGEVPHMIPPLVLIGVLVGSWALRPESRRLAGADLPGGKARGEQGDRSQES